MVLKAKKRIKLLVALFENLLNNGARGFILSSFSRYLYSSHYYVGGSKRDYNAVQRPRCLLPRGQVTLPNLKIGMSSFILLKARNLCGNTACQKRALRLNKFIFLY